MMFDSVKIEERMKELKFTYDSLARGLNISEELLKRVIGNKTAADTLITEKLKNCLCIDNRESGKYFFCHGVAQNATNDSDRKIDK